MRLPSLANDSSNRLPPKLKRTKLSQGQPRRPQVDQYFDLESITIGEALETTTISVGDKPVDSSDAAAIQTAETIAAGCDDRQRGGLGANVQAAASFNARAARDVTKITNSDVLSVILRNHKQIFSFHLECIFSKSK
ncbi:late embryogenesis abundant protein 3-like [Durio zibethinus]|uniref:Late embryogenesis abundant protein 3-like n=1 Tax=Durio zibethinus TaxID=66656 RepID=A0A6P6AXE0_DURZI|nr:late embryogenesis abundant protein 3-like [Durio zibethinus]